MTRGSDSNRGDARTLSELADRIDELRRRKSSHPPLPDDRHGEIWTDDEKRCLAYRDPDTDDKWLLDAEDGTTYSLGSLAEWWTTTLQQQSPDEVLGDR